MVRRNSVSERRSKAKSMDPWETDGQGRYAGHMDMLDPIFILGLIPILGAVYALTMIASGYNIAPSGTGVPQQSIRGGHVGLVSQVFWIIAIVVGGVI